MTEEVVSAIEQPPEGVRAEPNYRHWLVSRYASTDLTAKQTCLGAWNLGPKAAAELQVSDLAKPPSNQTGSYAPYLHRALGLDEAADKYIFETKIPQHGGKRVGRKLLLHPFLLPHRQIHEFPDNCVSSDPEFLRIPMNARILRQEGQLSMGLARLYVDGVDTGGKSRKIPQKVYCFMWAPLGCSAKGADRRLITILPDNRCCRTCGCGGRCTRNAVWTVCAWSWHAAKSGVHPATGPFGETLTGSWATLAGQPIAGGRAAVAQLAADWEGFADICGFRRWNHTRAPCCWCKTPLHQMYDIAAPHEALTRADYADAKAHHFMTTTTTTTTMVMTM